MLSRRAFLLGTGGVTVLVAGGGVWRAGRQGVFRAGRGPAYEPWENWRSEADDGPLALVRAGILAANPHNTQPWLFQVDDSSVELYADTGRNLGPFDPYLREMYIGLGCAVENMMRAAVASGFEAGLTLHSGTLEPPGAAGEPVAVARLDLTSRQAEADELYAAIGQRHTNRGPYDGQRRPDADTLAALEEIGADETDVKVVLFPDEPQRGEFGSLVIEATEEIIADGPMVDASERWFRHSWADVQEFRDGPTLDSAGLSPAMTTMAKMMPRPSAEANHAYWLDATRDVQIPTTPVFGLIAVRDLYDKQQTLRAGRLWQRKHLWATPRGLAMQPLNQPVEVVDRQREIGAEPAMQRRLEAFVTDPAWRPTFAFRAGYPLREANRSPRRAVEDVMI